MAFMQWLRKGFMPVFVIVGIVMCQLTTAMAANFVVITNKNVSENTLSKADLQAIYLGEKVKWENKKYIKIAILEDKEVYKDFLNSIVGKTPSQFDQHWMRLVSTGKASMPPYFTEAQQLIDYVAKHPNAVGFAAAGQGNSSVKIISIK